MYYRNSVTPACLIQRRCSVNGSRAESGCTPQRGLGGEIEEFVDESHFTCDPGFDQDAMAAPDHAHDLEALDRGVSGLHRLEAPGGTDQLFQRTMIGLDPVVEVLRRPVPDSVF